MATDRREEIIELTSELLSTLGYNSFSYKDLSDRLGITKAAIHHHFPNKEDLGVAAMKSYHECVRRNLEGAGGESGGPWDQFGGYLEMVESILDSPGNCICAAGAVQSEHNSVPESLQAEAKALIRFIIGWITDVIEEGRRLGEMKFPGAAKDQAMFIFTAVQGALQLGRAQGKEKAQSVFAQIRQNLKPEEAITAGA